MAENSNSCLTALNNLTRFGWVEVVEDLKVELRVSVETLSGGEVSGSVFF